VKKLTISLEYLAKTYGIDNLMAATITRNDDGSYESLIIQGEKTKPS